MLSINLFSYQVARFIILTFISNLWKSKNKIYLFLGDTMFVVNIELAKKFKVLSWYRLILVYFIDSKIDFFIWFKVWNKGSYLMRMKLNITEKKLLIQSSTNCIIGKKYRFVWLDCKPLKLKLLIFSFKNKTINYLLIF